MRTFSDAENEEEKSKQDHWRALAALHRFPTLLLLLLFRLVLLR
jgi:hypothetical protein